jgi:membrane-associated phospholipid phosphatase
MKKVISENRPQFFDICRPDSAVNCTVGEYIASYNCTNTEYPRVILRDPNNSFPSGHAAFSFFVALFMIRYLQYRCKEVRNQYLLKFLFLLLVAMAAFCSFSRIYDRRHFWWDVAAGILLGVLFTFYTVRKIIPIEI